MKKKIIIVFLLLIAQGCTKPEEKIKRYLENGKELIKKGDYDKAKIEFKNVIQLDSKEAEAYYQLALIDEKKQNWQSMYANLKKAVRLNQNNFEGFLKLARLELLANQLDEALKHIEMILKGEPENADALALKGAILIKQGGNDKAMELAEKVLKRQPDHTDSISLKTVVFLAKDDTAKALETVDNGLKLKPNEPSLLQLKLQVHLQEKNFVAVEQDFMNLIQLFPEKLDYTYALVKHYSDHNEQDKALALLQKVLDSHPDDIQPKLVMIDYLTQKKPELLEKTFPAYLEKHPNEPDLYFRLASYNLSQSKFDEAKKALTKIVELKPATKEERSAKAMLAKIALQDEDTQLAETLVGQITKEDPSDLDGLLLKARMDLQKGLYDEAIANLRVIMGDYSASDEALVLLGQAYLKKNSPELAEENFRKALDVNPSNFDALLPVAASMVKNNDLKKAEELLHKALELKPNHPIALQALAQLKLLQKDWRGAQGVADVIAIKTNGKGFAKFLSGKISEQQGLYKEAIGQYKEALSTNPDLKDALRGIQASYESLKQNTEIFAYLDEFIAAHPDDPYPWLLKGEILIKNKQLDEALKTYNEANAKWPKLLEFYEAIANLYVEKNESAKAIDIVNKGIETTTEQIRLKLFLASLYEKTADYEKAKSTYESIIAINPNVEVAVNNLVSLLLDHFNTKENVDKALALAKSFEHSDQPYFVDSYGWALLMSGQNDSALSVLRDVAKKSPETAVFRYHLGTAYHKTNNRALAISELETAIKLGKKSNDFNELKMAEELLKTIKTSTTK